MPNPLMLQVMGVSISEYNTYSAAKKARFQKEATKRIAAVHSSDPAAYNNLTAETVKMVAQTAEDNAMAEIEDQEGE